MHCKTPAARISGSMGRRFLSRAPFAQRCAVLEHVLQVGAGLGWAAFQNAPGAAIGGAVTLARWFGHVVQRYFSPALKSSYDRALAMQEPEAQSTIVRMSTDNPDAGRRLCIDSTDLRPVRSFMENVQPPAVLSASVFVQQFECRFMTLAFTISVRGSIRRNLSLF